jgi:hypothetical protein
MELLGVRQAVPIEPEPLVEPDGIDDKRIALPPADRVAVIRSKMKAKPAPEGTESSNR